MAAVVNAQQAAGLDIVTDGDSRFDLAVGGKSWFFYPIERLGGIQGHRDTSRGWMQRHGLRPGRILWEVQEAYQPGVVKDKLTRGPLEYTELWKVAQRLTDRPMKFGAICAPALASMLWDEHYRDERLIRKALEYIPPERLVITTDCGFGRKGLSRCIAYYKCVALVEGTNIVRRELGLPEAHVRAADPRLWFASTAE